MSSGRPARSKRTDRPARRSWPSALAPQHCTVPLLRRAQACRPLVATALKCPPGGISASAFRPPQHWMSPSARNAQLCPDPADRATYSPAGALSVPFSSSPQHAIVPSTWIAQLWLSPEATAMKRPSGASLWPYLLSPQHTIVPSARMAHVCLRPVAIAVNGPSSGRGSGDRRVTSPWASGSPPAGSDSLTVEPEQPVAASASTRRASTTRRLGRCESDLDVVDLIWCAQLRQFGDAACRGVSTGVPSGRFRWLGLVSRCG